MQFEWDEQERERNIRKHSIDFVDVPEVFAFPMLTALDDRRDYGEDRWIGIGFLRFRIVVVAYTFIDEDRIRIISARRALKHEEERFRQYLEDQLGPS